MTKRLERLKSLMLMSVRCEYIEGLILTKKGKGFLTPNQWRQFNRIKEFVFPQWKRDMDSFFNDIRRINKIEELKP